MQHQILRYMRLYQIQFLSADTFRKVAKQSNINAANPSIHTEVMSYNWQVRNSLIQLNANNKMNTELRLLDSHSSQILEKYKHQIDTKMNLHWA